MRSLPSSVRYLSTARALRPLTTRGRGAPRAVVVSRPAADAAPGHRAQQRKARAHPRPAADEDQILVALPQREHPVGPRQAEPVAHRQLGVKEMGEQAIRADLDDELELT